MRGSRRSWRSWGARIGLGLERDAAGGVEPPGTADAREVEDNARAVHCILGKWMGGDVGMATVLGIMGETGSKLRFVADCLDMDVCVSLPPMVKGDPSASDTSWANKAGDDTFDVSWDLHFSWAFFLPFDLKGEATGDGKADAPGVGMGDGNADGEGDESATGRQYGVSTGDRGVGFHDPPDAGTGASTDCNNDVVMVVASISLPARKLDPMAGWRWRVAMGGAVVGTKAAARSRG